MDRREIDRASDRSGFAFQSLIEYTQSILRQIWPRNSAYSSFPGELPGVCADADRTNAAGTIDDASINISIAPLLKSPHRKGNALLPPLELCYRLKMQGVSSGAAPGLQFNPQSNSWIARDGHAGKRRLYGDSQGIYAKQDNPYRCRAGPFYINRRLA